MIDEERLMRYATAIAADDMDNLFGGERPLPALDHPHWNTWKRTAAVAIRVADEENPMEADTYVPPPPGSTRKQLPDDVLALIVIRPYISTACETARALQSALIRHPDQVKKLALWRDRMHDECRINHKFQGNLCKCSCHQEVT